MKTDAISTVPELAQTLPKQDRLLLGRLIEECGELIVFGSRAAGVHSSNSDLDILCVRSKSLMGSGQLDIVSRSPGEIENPKWLGSELANHIAAYGIVLCGSADWRSAAHVSAAAVSHKQRRVISLVDGLWAYWERLHPEFRRKYLKTIRREIQRLEYLGQGNPVPPTPLLDRKWGQETGALEGWVKFLQTIAAPSPLTRERLLRTADLVAEPDAVSKRSSLPAD